MCLKKIPHNIDSCFWSMIKLGILPSGICAYCSRRFTLILCIWKHFKELLKLEQGRVFFVSFGELCCPRWRRLRQRRRHVDVVCLFCAKKFHVLVCLLLCLFALLCAVCSAKNSSAAPKAAATTTITIATNTTTKTKGCPVTRKIFLRISTMPYAFNVTLSTYTGSHTHTQLQLLIQIRSSTTVHALHTHTHTHPHPHRPSHNHIFHFGNNSTQWIAASSCFGLASMQLLPYRQLQSGYASYSGVYKYSTH